MAGQLPAGDRLIRLRRTGLLVAAVAAAAAVATGLWLLRLSAAPRSRCVVRPEVSVQGVVAGSTVRLSGVVVGQVVRVGLWSDPVSGRARPELVLSLDADREPGLLQLPRLVKQGLRAELAPVNPASGFLEVNLVWSPGSPSRLATADPDEVPWQPSGQQEGVAQVIPVVQRLAAEDFRAHVDGLAASLEAVELRVADGPRVVAMLSGRAARLRATAARIESAAGPDAVATMQVRLADLREGLRVAEATLASLDRDLEAWPGPAGESLRAFSRSCRASADRLRRQVPEDAAR